MADLQFITFQKENAEHMEVFRRFFGNLAYETWLGYDEPTYDEINEWFLDVTETDCGRHIEFLRDNNEYIGLLYGKVDRENHSGFVKPGFGCVENFYIYPQFRRLGYSRFIWSRFEELFALDGAKFMYFDCDSEKWALSLGFFPANEIHSVTNMPIFVKEIKV